MKLKLIAIFLYFLMMSGALVFAQDNPEWFGVNVIYPTKQDVMYFCKLENGLEKDFLEKKDNDYVLLQNVMWIDDTEDGAEALFKLSEYKVYADDIYIINLGSR